MTHPAISSSGSHIKKILKPLLKSWFTVITGVPPKCNILNPNYLHSSHLNQAILDALELLPDRARVLDIGCGRQPYREYFTRQGALYFGIEPFTPETRKENAPSPDCAADAHQLPIDANTIDFILLTEVLEHADHPSRLLKEIERVLKPGGFLIVTMPFLFLEHKDPMDYRRFTPDGLIQLAQMEGIAFEAEMIKKLGGTGTVLMQNLQNVIYEKLLSSSAGTYFYYSAGLIIMPIASLAFNLVGLILNTLLSSKTVYSGILVAFRKKSDS